MTPTSTIELLAPAKDLETGLAAINCGADAVYLGAARFGAREAAGNPLGDVEQLIAYAHRYWAKVYIVVNTLLKDDELDDAQQLITQVYQAGADALILQDPGLLELDLPPLPLFASTQMHNHNPQRVAFLAGVGFQRAILARELSLPEIHAIHAATPIELEAFIHGALCVGYSGQCYLSYAIGGRSGNRGQCAQPCRRAYSLVGRGGQVVAERRYLLSLRDLNLGASLDDLIDAGVSSFKIEGRLKDRAYVMNVVGYHRRLLDGVLNRRAMRPASSGTAHLDFAPDPYKTFNRGFSTYFLYGRGETLTSSNTPKSLGEPLGKIAATARTSFTLAATAPALHAGDGLCFFDDRNELTGTRVQRVVDEHIFPDSMIGLTTGKPLFRNHDHEFSESLRKTQPARKIALTLRLSHQAGGLLCSVTDEDGNQAQVEQALELTAAHQPEQARETILRQMHKMGASDFTCAAVELDLEPMPFIPLAALNALRRAVLQRLEQVRAANRPILTGGAVRNDLPYPQTHLTFEGNVLNRKAADFYARHGVQHIEPAAESGLNLTGRKVMTSKTCLRYELHACPRQDNALTLPEPLHLVDEQGFKYPLVFNCADCVMEVYFQGGQP